jgi:ABC-2 type transport system permease protein
VPPLARLLGGQLTYHTRVLLGTPRAVVGGMLLPILLLLLRDQTSHATHLERVRLVAGLIAFGALSTAYITHTASLVAARQDGVLKRWRVTPLPAWCFFAGRIAAVALLAVIGGALTALVGTAHEHLHLSLATIGVLALILMLGAATWASIGTAVSPLIPTTESAWPLLGLTYLPLVILSGGFGTVNGQAGWLATLIDCLPVRPIIDSTSRALQSGSGVPPVRLHELAVLAAWAVTGLVLSLSRFRWTPRLGDSRRAGGERAREWRSLERGAHRGDGFEQRGQWSE